MSVVQEQRSPLMDAMGGLQESIQELKVRVDTLSQRLSPVCAPFNAEFRVKDRPELHQHRDAVDSNSNSVVVSDLMHMKNIVEETHMLIANLQSNLQV